MDGDGGRGKKRGKKADLEMPGTADTKTQWPRDQELVGETRRMFACGWCFFFGFDGTGTVIAGSIFFW